MFLDKPQVQVDLLAIGTHAGLHRYTFKDVSALSETGLVIDICHAAELQEGPFHDIECINGTVWIAEGGQSLRASIFFAGHLSQKIWVHMHMDFATNKKTSTFTAWRACTGLRLNESCAVAEPTTFSDTGVLFLIGTLGARAGAGDADLGGAGSGGSGGGAAGGEGVGSDLEVSVRTGLSFISPDLAEANLRAAAAPAPAPDPWAFDSLAARTKSIWCDELAHLAFSALPGDLDLDAVLHTAHYRTAMSPSVYSEAGGLYLGFDGLVHNVTAERVALYGAAGLAQGRMGYEFFSDLSLWDTYRTQHPWLLLVNEDVALGTLRSMEEITQQQNSFPRWVMVNHERSCMIGEGGAAAVLEAALCGMGKELDVAGIQQVLVKQSTQPWYPNGRTDVEHYMSAGFVSMESSKEAASLTLTYAFDDFVLAGLSEFVGDSAAAAAAHARSKNYAKLWSNESQTVCPRSVDGSLHCPANPALDWADFTEGNALQWMWFVPHDPAGLVALFGSGKAYDSALASFFENHVFYAERDGNPIPNPYYWAGNEHDSFAAFMFSFGPNCTRTQYWSRRLTHMHFSNTGHGIPGNEDYGAMSSWLAFAALGLFPQAGTSRFVIGSPRVAEASLSLRGRRGGATSTLRIVAYNNSAENVFVDRLLVNGAYHESPFIDRSALAGHGTGSGGETVTLEFFMHSAPRSGLCYAACEM